MRLRSRLTLLAFLAAAAAPLAAQGTASAPRPTLVVFFTIDQMRADYFDRFASQLTGGLARLYRGGAFFPNAFQDHAITETAPGHSVTLSGRFPRGTGIVANVYGVQDDQAPLIGGGGPGASPYRFRGSALIDWMRLADPRARALSISRKDRGAILPLGRAKQSVFWYASDGRFTTSSYYADTLPSWVQRFNARRTVAGYAGREWTLLLPASAYPEADSVPQESGGKDYVFPHRLPADTAAAVRAFASFPWMDEMTLQAALEGMQAMRLGAGPQTDLLAISLSTTDAVGHQYGPDSRELHDQILRLDRALGVFLDSLYRLRDSATVVVALTADHGVSPYPELRAARTHTTPGRADLTPVVARLTARLQAAGLGAEAARFDEGLLWVDRAKLSAAGVSPDSLARAFAAAARRVPAVQRADLVAELATRDTTRDYVARRWLHMLPPDLPVAAVVTLEPYAYWAQTNYATHGEPHDPDAQVPVLFYGPWFRPGRYAQRALVADIAPTLARVLGLTPFERLDGRVRTEALQH